jgi:hypothetical protein
VSAKQGRNLPWENDSVSLIGVGLHEKWVISDITDLDQYVKIFQSVVTFKPRT